MICQDPAHSQEDILWCSLFGGSEGNTLLSKIFEGASIKKGKT